LGKVGNNRFPEDTYIDRAKAAVHYVFSTFVVVTKDIAGKSALNYSKRIVHGRWWFVFGNLLLIFIIAIIIWLPFYILFRMLPELNTLDRIMSYIINGLLGAFGTVMYFVLFTKLDEGQEIQAQEGAMAPNLSST
jgi:drug/metabolite transporter (DMT)-like permease